MRYIMVVLGVLAGVVLLVYSLLFTSFGNALLKPMVESKVNQTIGFDGKLERFSLGFSSFGITYEVDKNTIKLDGDYSLFQKSFDAIYALDLQNLSSFSKLADMPLRGSLGIEGGVKGDLIHVQSDGVLTLAKTPVVYKINLEDFNPTKIVLSSSGLKLEEILNIISKNPYAKALVDLDININSIKENNLDADINISTKNAILSSKYMKSDFDVDIPDTPFNLALNSKLKGDEANYNLLLSSKLFDIKSSGELTPQPLKVDSTYSLNIANLEALKPITGQNFKGSFKTDGTIKGDDNNLVVKGSSDVASSATKYIATLKKKNLDELVLDIAHLNIAKLLEMLGEPSYVSKGTLALEAKLKGFSTDNLNGDILVASDGVLLNQATIKKEFELDLPTTSADIRALVDIKDGVAKSNSIKIDSNLAKLALKEFRYDLKKLSLDSNYELNVADLSKLFFITKTPMQGSFVADGELKQDSDLLISINSKSIGDLKAKLLNDDFEANITNLKASKLLYTLKKPDILESDLEAKLKYNLVSASGDADVKLANAKFNQNQVFDQLKALANIDLYKESLNGNATAKIDKNLTLATLDLLSKNASIVSPKTLLDSDKNSIDSDILLTYKKDEIKANLKGSVEKPTITIDLDAFLKSRAGEKLLKKADKLLDKLFK